METLIEDAVNDEPVDNGVPYRQTTAEDRMMIFMTVKSTMVEGRPKHGIFRALADQLKFKPRIIAKHWNTMAKKLADLLSNHPDEEEHVVIARSHHILFKTGHSDRRSGKFKFDREELTATIASVPLKSRMNYRHLATKIGVPRTTVYYFLKPRPKRVSRA
jgi:hypothetical protein